jgi:DNA mismatch repair protein MSH6
MAKGSVAASSPSVAATPTTGALKRSSSSTQNMKNQKSILGFFQKSSPVTPSTATGNAEPASSPAQRASENKTATKAKRGLQHLTPVPSSDAIEPDEYKLSAEKVGLILAN